MKRPTAVALGVLAVAVLVLGLYAARPRSPHAREAQPRLIRLEPASAGAELLGDGASMKLRAIVTDVPSTLSWRVRVPDGARLETHLSFARSEISALGLLTCQARIEAGQGPRDTQVLLERELHPGSGWEPFLVDLSRLGGRWVDLRFEVACPGTRQRPRSRAARWSVPVISTPRLPDDVNVLLISIDTLRADHIGAYGYPRPTSPHIDGLARRGLRFENAETVQSATWPALTSLHTSLYPSAHGVVWNGGRLPEGPTTLAEILHSKQYSTSAFITNMTRARHPGWSRLFLSRGGGQVEADRNAVDQALRQFRLERERRFFMWVHLLSPHAAYDPPPPHATAFTRPGASAVKAEIDVLASLRRRNVALTDRDLAHVIGLYDGEVSYVDSLVGELLGGLRELGLERSTLVVLTADHGEDLHEHNRYFFHSPSIYGSSMRVPLVLALPGVLPEGVMTDHPASLIDLAPTILGLLALPAPAQFQGENLLPGRALPGHPVRKRIFGETNGRIHSVRSAEWRFVYNPEGLHPEAPGGPYPIGDVELFDLRKDPRERHNLARARPDLVRAFTAEVQAWKTRYVRKGANEGSIDPEALEELRALGYLMN